MCNCTYREAVVRCECNQYFKDIISNKADTFQMYQEYKYAHCDRLIEKGSVSKICMEMINVIVYFLIIYACLL